MPNPILPHYDLKVHRMQAALHRRGVSFQGAQQFAAGVPVASAADRQALALVVANILQNVGLGSERWNFDKGG